MLATNWLQQFGCKCGATSLDYDEQVRRILSPFFEAHLWIYDLTLVEGSGWFVLVKPSARQLESSRVPRE